MVEAKAMKMKIKRTTALSYSHGKDKGKTGVVKAVFPKKTACLWLVSTW